MNRRAVAALYISTQKLTALCVRERAKSRELSERIPTCHCEQESQVEEAYLRETDSIEPIA